MELELELGPLPKLHPRHDPFVEAKAKLTDALSAIRKEHALTPSEEFMLLGEMVAHLGQMCVTSERRKSGA